MKNYIYAATALLAFGLVTPPAHASGIISSDTFNFGGSAAATIGTSATFNGSVAGTTVKATGYDCAGQLCASVPNPTNPDLTAAMFQESVGLGMNGSSNYITTNGTYTYDEQEIPNTQFIQLDFSTLVGKLGTADIKDIIITVTDVVNSFAVFTSNVPGKLEGNLGTAASGGNIAVSPLAAGVTSTFELTSNFNQLVDVLAGTNCHVVLEKAEVDYVPEPGTLVLMGCALLGLGVAGKKLRRNRS